MATPTRNARILSRDGKIRDFALSKGGSSFRNGDRTCYLGFPVGTSVADGAASAAHQEMSIVESAVLDRFVIQSRNRVAITSLSHTGSPLVSGHVPAAIFAPDSLCNPYAGLYVDQTSKVRYTLQNDSGGAVIPTAGWSTATAGSPVLGPDHGLLAVGGPALTTIGEGTAATLAFNIEKAALLDKLVIDYGGTSIDEVDLYISSIRYDGDELLGAGVMPIAMFRADSPWNTSLGVYVEPGHTLTVTIHNQDAAQDAEILAGFTVKR